MPSEHDQPLNHAAPIDKPKHPGGRPSEYTQDVADRICDAIATGQTLAKLCHSTDWTPDTNTVYRWLRSNDEFRDSYDRAREDRQDLHADEVLEISDAPAPDIVAVKHAELRVKARMWLMERLKPRKYGNQMKVDVSGTLTLGVLIERAHQMIDQERDARVIDGSTDYVSATAADKST